MSLSSRASHDSDGDERARDAPAPPGARDNVARDLFARELQGETDAGDTDAAVVAAAERIGARISEGLSRWFGPYGSRALVTRALARARADHPSLAAVGVNAEPAPSLTGLAESTRVHGARATADGVIALVAALSESLGQLIGDDLAASVLAQCVAAAPRADPSGGTGTTGGAPPPVKEP